MEAWQKADLALRHADYTYGNDYDAQGQMKYGQGVSPFFHWDKRDFTYVYPPKNFPSPACRGLAQPCSIRPPCVCLACSVSEQCVDGEKE